jgi:hypothetical protein
VRKEKYLLPGYKTVCRDRHLFSIDQVALWLHPDLVATDVLEALHECNWRASLPRLDR